MLELMEKGGVLMYPIMLCSVFALAIFVERVIRYARMKSRGAGLAEKTIGFLNQGKEIEAVAFALESNSPMGRVLAKVIDVKDQDRETIETVMVHSTDEEVRDLSSYVQTLATIGNIAPLLGLLGTVLGMIKAFMVIQQMGGKVNAAVLAGGIWEAMLTTAAGLAVALPTMVMHSYLLSRIDQYEARLQEGGVAFLKAISKRKSS